MFSMEITRLIERCRQGDADGESLSGYVNLLHLLVLILCAKLQNKNHICCLILIFLSIFAKSKCVTRTNRPFVGL